MSAPADAQAVADAAAAEIARTDRAFKMLGMAVEEIEPGRAVLSMIVRDDMLNGVDLCHGGLIFTLADTCFAFTTFSTGVKTLAQQASINWLAPAYAGDTLLAEGVLVATTGKSGVCDITIRRDNGTSIATIAIVRALARIIRPKS